MRTPPLPKKNCIPGEYDFGDQIKSSAFWKRENSAKRVGMPPNKKTNGSGKVKYGGDKLFWVFTMNMMGHDIPMAAAMMAEYREKGDNIENNNCPWAELRPADWFAPEWIRQPQELNPDSMLGRKQRCLDLHSIKKK